MTTIFECRCGLELKLYGINMGQASNKIIFEDCETCYDNVRLKLTNESKKMMEDVCNEFEEKDQEVIPREIVKSVISNVGTWICAKCEKQMGKDTSIFHMVYGKDICRTCCEHAVATHVMQENCEHLKVENYKCLDCNKGLAIQDPL